MVIGRKRGLSLIEILVVVVILGILAAIAMPRFMNAAYRTKDNTCQANISIMNEAVERYYAQNGYLPKKLAKLTTDVNYFPLGIPVCPNGGDYRLDDDGSVVCTCLEHNHSGQKGDSGSSSDKIRKPRWDGIPYQSSPTAQISSASVDKWISSDYSFEKGYAELSFAGVGQKLTDISKERRSMALTKQIPQSGVYSYQLDTKLTDYYKQFHYWQVYLTKEGTDLNLNGGPKWYQRFSGAKRIHGDYTRPGHDDEQWHTFSHDFNISQRDAAEYDYVTFVLVGSKREGEEMAFDNFQTNLR